MNNQVESFTSMIEQLAMDGYDAYGQDADWKTFDGRPMPKWHDLGDAVRTHWMQAAHTIASKINPKYLEGQKGDGTPWLYAFDEREQSEINFSRLYRREYKHGTDGHNAKVIIAKMANLLDANEAKAIPYEEKS